MLAESNLLDNIGNTPNVTERYGTRRKLSCDVARRVTARLTWKMPSGGEVLIHEVPRGRNGRMGVWDDEAVLITE